MAYRYSNTDKWSDSWFLGLKPLEKTLFNYLCDNCDIAGFIEINIKVWASQIKSNTRGIEGALKGLGRGLIYSKNNDCIYVKNFLRNQKNIPLNPDKNMSHRGIMKRFELYKTKFDNETIEYIIKGALKGLPSPYGNGIGILKKEESRGENKVNFKFFTYDQMLYKLDKAGGDTKFWDDYKPVKLDGISKPVYVHVNEIKKHGIEILTS